jgi:hypothetical protein
MAGGVVIMGIPIRLPIDMSAYVGPAWSPALTDSECADQGYDLNRTTESFSGDAAAGGPSYMTGVGAPGSATVVLTYPGGFEGYSLVEIDDDDALSADWGEVVLAVLCPTSVGVFCEFDAQGTLSDNFVKIWVNGTLVMTQVAVKRAGGWYPGAGNYNGGAYPDPYWDNPDPYDTTYQPQIITLTPNPCGNIIRIRGEATGATDAYVRVGLVWNLTTGPAATP